MAKTVFSSSEAKGYIRDEFDFNLIRTFKDQYYPGIDLSYLGLPGEQLLDILSWRGLIDRWTGVQAVGTPELDEAASNMVQNALRYRLERGFQPVRGNIDHLLASGSDKLRWPYQIVNLDYIGGLLGAAERVDALDALFAKQTGNAFILLLTLNLRDKDHGELSSSVHDEQEELKALGIGGVDGLIAAHQEYGNAGLLKIYLPLMLANHASHHSLSFSMPVLYNGTKQMIHFAVICAPYGERRSGRVLRISEKVQLLNLPLGLLHRRDDLRKAQLGFLTLEGPADDEQ